MNNLKSKFMVFFLVLAVLVGLPSISNANELTTNYDSQQTIERRINISSDDLLITEEGIYFIKSGEALPVRAVFADLDGLYIIESALNTGRQDRIWNTCDNGHDIYHPACGGCGFWWCNFRCKCYSPW